MKKSIAFTITLSLIMGLFLGCEFDDEEENGNNNNSNTTYYSVTYDPNGGVTDASDSSSYMSGWSATVATTFDSTTYKTSGSGRLALESWNTKADGSGTTYYAGDTFTITGNTTLYAQWNKYYVGERVTASDIFGNTVTGYIAYIKPEGASTFSYTAASTYTTYTISNAGGESWKYLIAIMDGTSSSNSYKYKNKTWAPNGTTTVSGLSENIGAGKANTDAIIAAYSSATTSDCAAKALKAANCYLPSLGEMAVIYQNLFYSNKVTPPTYTIESGIGNFTVSYYYTSNQPTDDSSSKAYVFDMYKTSLTKGSKTAYSKTSNTTVDVCTLGVSYIAK